MPTDLNAISVSTTTGDRSLAERIAVELVDRRLAACVQVEGPITSTFRWQGAIETQSEWRLVIKTLADRLTGIEAVLAEMHPYDVPELLATPVVGGSEAYLTWLQSAVAAENI